MTGWELSLRGAKKAHISIRKSVSYGWVGTGVSRPSEIGSSSSSVIRLVTPLHLRHGSLIDRIIRLRARLGRTLHHVPFGSTRARPGYFSAFHHSRIGALCTGSVCLAAFRSHQW